MKTTRITDDVFFVELEGDEKEPRSFMHCVGLTCPEREAIERDGENKCQHDFLQTILRAHEKGCDRCKADYEELYASGMLNGEKPDFLKEK